MNSYETANAEDPQFQLDWDAERYEVESWVEEQEAKEID